MTLSCRGSWSISLPTSGWASTRGFLAVDPGIDVSGAGDLKFLKPWNLAQSRHNLFRDLTGRFAQLLGQLKAQRQRVLAQPDVGRLIDHDPRQLNVILPLQQVTNALDKLLL